MKFRESIGYDEQVAATVESIVASNGVPAVVHPTLGEIEVVFQTGKHGIADSLFWTMFLQKDSSVLGHFHLGQTSTGVDLIHRTVFERRVGLGWFAVDVLEGVVGNTRSKVLYSLFNRRADGNEFHCFDQPDMANLLLNRGFEIVGGACDRSIKMEKACGV